jgi:hypothetical protein
MKVLNCFDANGRFARLSFEISDGSTPTFQISNHLILKLLHEMFFFTPPSKNKGQATPSPQKNETFFLG